MTFQYDFDHKFRGRALIIGNQFKTYAKGKIVIGRKGCEEDLKMMKELFKRFDFIVDVHKNLKADDMKIELEKAAKSAENEDSDCFVLVLSTHGEEIKDSKGTGSSSAAVWKNAVLGEDGEKVYVEEIVNMFTHDNAPSLDKKPKLFFIQACKSRGSCSSSTHISYSKFDQGYTISVEKPALPTKGQPKKPWLYTDVDVSNEYNQLYKQWQDLQSKVDYSQGGTCVTSEDPNKLKDKDDKSVGETSTGSDVDSYRGSCSTDEYRKDDDDTIDDRDEDTSDGEDSLRVEQTTKTSKETVEEDTKGVSNPLSQSSSTPMPLTQFDVVPINCPEDFLIMYPVMPEKAAIRYPSGSYLLQCLHKGENMSQLINNGNILHYLTSVSQDMAMKEFSPDLMMTSVTKGKRENELRRLMESNIKHLSQNKKLLTKVLSRGAIPDNETLIAQYLKNTTFTEKEMQDILRGILPFKVTACLVHRLRDSVCFRPKPGTSPMKKVVDDYNINHPQVNC